MMVAPKGFKRGSIGSIANMAPHGLNPGNQQPTLNFCGVAKKCRRARACGNVEVPNSHGM